MTAVDHVHVEENEPLVHLDFEGHRISLLGTAHVSQASADAVKRLIESGEYDTIAVELCPSRHHTLINPDALAEMDMFDVIRQGKASMVAANLALGAYQQRLADEFGIRPGEEMRVAVQLAKDHDLPVLLIDREIGISLKRVYHNVPWWKRFSLVSGLLASLVSREKVTEADIEKLKEGDVLESTFAQFADNAQEIYQPLVDERDRFMAARIKQEHQADSTKKTLVVIGAGHLKGIQNYLLDSQRDADSEVETLNQIPPPSRWPKILPWVIVGLVLIGFAIGFSRSTELGTQLIIDWILINGTLAAVGAMLAGAHILTILVAFIAAPLTSLNPTVGAGMVTAATEIFVRRPNVGHFSALRKDVTSVRGWWRNRVTRILMVFIFSTLGSAAGTYVAGFRIFERLSS